MLNQLIKKRIDKNQIHNRPRIGLMMPMATRMMILTAALMLLSGCQQLTGDSVIQVIGEVRMDRRPVADARVAFVPIEFRNRNGSINPIGFGTTNDAGRFELRTEDTKGIVAGQYSVLFFKPFAESAAGSPANQIGLLQRSQNGQQKFWQSILEIVFPFQEKDLTPRSQPFQTTLAQIQSQSIPMQYNLETQIRFTVKSGSGILYPKFELHSHPKN